MKYYYKIFVKEGIQESLKFLNIPESFINELLENSSFKNKIDQKMSEFYIGYDVESITKGKSLWTWSSGKTPYKHWNFRGEVHPHRKDKISKLKKLWENEDLI